MHKEDKAMPEKEVDLYRDTPVRYLGYANEVGEAFRSLIGSKWVAASYALATAYVFADAIDKSRKMYKENINDKLVYQKTAYAATDTLIWQMLASVVIPGFTINRVCAASSYLIKKQTSMPKTTRKWVVAVIGLATVPFIIKPIDHSVDMLLDHTYRKLAP